MRKTKPQETTLSHIRHEQAGSDLNWSPRYLGLPTMSKQYYITFELSLPQSVKNSCPPLGRRDIRYPLHVYRANAHTLLQASSHVVMSCPPPPPPYASIPPSLRPFRPLMAGCTCTRTPPFTPPPPPPQAAPLHSTISSSSIDKQKCRASALPCKPRSHRNDYLAS